MREEALSALVRRFAASRWAVLSRACLRPAAHRVGAGGAGRCRRLFPVSGLLPMAIWLAGWSGHCAAWRGAARAFPGGYRDGVAAVTPDSVNNVRAGFAPGASVPGFSWPDGGIAGGAAGLVMTGKLAGATAIWGW